MLLLFAPALFTQRASWDTTSYRWMAALPLGHSFRAVTRRNLYLCSGRKDDINRSLGSCSILATAYDPVE